MALLRNFHVIGIDEGQFFADLVPVCKQLAREALCESIIITALNGDYKQCMFPSVVHLIPYSTIIEHVTARCDVCTKPANFSLLAEREPQQPILTNSDGFMIGGEGMYTVRCWNCSTFFE